jgi:Pentapeptide repeats (8 copies)
MGQLRRSRWWLLWLGLGVGLAVAAFGWLLWRGPAWVYRGAWPRLTAAEQVTATGQFRIALIQVAAAAGAVVALAYTARTYRLANRGQLTERFSKALERLGSDEPYVRLGGVHALAHLLRDSADHHQDVVEVLVAFVRQRAPRTASRTQVTGHGADTRAGVLLLVASDQALPAEPAPDVQAALTALGHRPHRPLEPRGMLNLGDLHLTRAELEGADLTGARLLGANLTGAEGLTQAQIEAALGDAATRLPTGLERPPSWTADQEAVADAAPASGAPSAAGGPPAPPAEHPR